MINKDKITAKHNNNNNNSNNNNNNKVSLKLFLFSPTAYRATVFALVSPHIGNPEPGPQSSQPSVAVRLTVSSKQ